MTTIKLKCTQSGPHPLVRTKTLISVQPCVDVNKYMVRTEKGRRCLLESNEVFDLSDYTDLINDKQGNVFSNGSGPNPEGCYKKYSDT